MLNPLISIIIPLFNSEKYIHELLNSFNNLDLELIELIFVDDGSKANEGEIINNYYQNKPIQYSVYHIENSGQAFARNLGLEMAKGTFISFVDSDDLVTTRYIDLIKLTKNISSYDVVIGSHLGFKGEITSSMFKYEKQRKRKFNNPTRIIQLFLKKEIKIHHSAMIIRKSFLDENNIRFESDLRFGEDTIFIWDILTKTINILSSDLLMYYYRIRSDSVISTSKIDQIENFLCILTNRLKTIDYMENPFVLPKLYGNTLFSTSRTISKFYDYHIFEEFIIKYSLSKIKISDIYGVRFYFIWLILKFSPHMAYKINRSI